LLVFFSVAREGAELVLLLYASYVGSVEEVGSFLSLLTNLTGFVLGLILALMLAFILFQTTRKLNIKKFFQVTSVILIVFAAGLLVHGLHEIFEFLELSGSPLANFFIWSEIWNINNTPLGDLLHFLFGWSYDPLNPGRFEKSVIGGIIVSLFGWNDNPALIEVAAYVLYYISIFVAVRQIKPLVREEETGPSVNQS
ncbi:MAG: FTR1 family protein, partial [Candidatus Thorarchaeota archaeon]